MEKINLGFIGCGQIARQRHIKELRGHPGASMAAFCDIVEDRAQEFAAEFGGAACTDYRDLLERDDIDAVFVLCTNDMHAQITIDALNAGKHVMCEKPMAATVELCGQMIEAARRNGRVLMVGHNQRLLPAHIKAREIIRSGKYGRVVTFRTTFGHTGCENFSCDGLATWLFRKEQAVFGTLADLGVHKADLLRFLLEEDINEVSAFAGTLNKRNHKGEPIEVEDNAVCLLKTRSGALGTLTASWTYEAEDNSTAIYFEKAVMKVFDDPKRDIVIRLRDGTEETFDLGGIQTNDNQFKSGIPEEFVNSLLEGRKPSIDPEDGLQAIRIVLACLESAQTGCKVVLD